MQRLMRLVLTGVSFLRLAAKALPALLCVFLAATLYAQDAVITLPGATATTGILSGTELSLVERTVPPGEMHLFRAYDGSYRNPVLVVEGFDPMNTTAPADVYALLNTAGGADMIRAAGRSVWIVNFGDGGGALTANASLVSQAVHQAANWGGLSNAQVDLMGLSMGGVISRYALAYDEQHGGPSDGLVRLFVSGDSPQQGANGPPSLQEIILFSNDPELAPLLGCDAALSLLYSSVTSYETNGCSLGALPSATNWIGSSAAHDWFYSNLNSLNGNGYPLKSRNIAVSNGSITPRLHNVGDPIYSARTYWTIFTRFMVCSETYPAYRLDVAPGSLGTDFAPGNIRQNDFELDEHFVATFIPTDSALDIRNGQSMFDRTLHQAQPVNHSTISTETTDFMLEELLGSERKYSPKYLPDGVNASIYDWIVTAVFQGVFYIQAPDRSSGLRVISSADVGMGDVVIIRGLMQSSAGERLMDASSVSVTGAAQMPRPLGMVNSSLGGSAFGPNTQGVTGASGLNNVGLLVATSGEVTQVGEEYLYIDDGSGITDGTGNFGVRVVCDSEGYEIGDHLVVTGISSCFETPAGLARRILVRTEDDIIRYAEPPMNE